MDEFLERYTFECRPDFAVKAQLPIKQTPFGSAIVSLGYEFSPELWKLTFKPQKWKTHRTHVRKVLLTPQLKDIRAFTNKLELGLLNFQLVAGYDYGIHRAGLHWRVTTKWGGGSSSVGRKEVVGIDRYGGRLEGRLRWNADHQFPAAEGELGTGVEECYDFDYGMFNFEVKKVEAVVVLPGIRGWGGGGKRGGGGGNYEDPK